MITQWINSNRYRRYPLAADCNLAANSGFELPLSALVDFSAVSYTLAPQAVYLSSVQLVAAGTPQAVFAFVDASTNALFSCTVPYSASFPYEAVLGSTTTYNVTAVFDVGVMAMLDDYAAGTYTFTDSPQVEPSRFAYQNIHRLHSVQAQGGDNTDVLSGDIYCVEGYNCSILVDTARDRVTIRAKAGAGAGVPCDQIDETVLTCNEVLLRINGLQAGEQGDFMLIGGEGVEVEPDPDNNQLVIRGRGDVTNILCEE